MTAVPINENIPIIKGLDLTNKELKKALESNTMLLLDVETSNICNLACPYCFRDIYGGHKALENELNLRERLDLLKQAKELGCKTIKITGAGEPLIDKLFWKMVTYANKLGMTVITFTNGMIIDKKMAKRLFNLDITLIVKCNSMKPEIEDVLVNRRGYAERRNKSLGYLMEVGFNKTKPTRLGLDAVLTTLNKDGILELLKFCRENDIFPLFRPFMPIGGGSRVKEWEISKEETLIIYEKAREMDRVKFGIEYDQILPYMGGVFCRQLHYALYVNILGEVYACTGSRRLLGNIKQNTLERIWNNETAKKIRNTPYSGCPLREAYWRGEKNYDCI